MARLFPWDPWFELKSAAEDMHRLVGEACKPGQFQPVADVVETVDEFLILIELPGLSREEVHLEVRGNQLAVFGELKPPLGLTQASFQSMERSYGCFARRFVLPVHIDPGTVRARMKSGLLRIEVPKRIQPSGNRHVPVVVEE
jgi:HSP20 family protein